MKKLSCKDVDPSTDCDFTATGKDAREVANKMLAHAKAEHADKLSGKSDSDARAMFESKVHD